MLESAGYIAKLYVTCFKIDKKNQRQLPVIEGATLMTGAAEKNS